MAVEPDYVNSGVETIFTKNEEIVAFLKPELESFLNFLSCFNESSFS